jgi:hypothetical protein
LRLAAQIAQGLGADRIGNPREIKRFLNAFGVRGTIAADRGIQIDPPVLVKLLILEERHREAFRHLAGLEPAEQATVIAGWERWAHGPSDGEEEVPVEVLKDAQAWAASEPSLAGHQLSAYLTLAAALRSEQIEVGLTPDQAALANRLVGEGTADRERAAAQLGALHPEEQRRVAALLYERLRRAEDLEAPLGALVLVAEHTAGLAAGVPPKVMSERLGHATVAFTLDTYTSALPAMDKSAADVVAELILGTEEVGGSRPSR